MSKQLLIAGGGIGGMAAALAAARAGWQVQVLERACAFSEVGAGIQLGPNVTRVLHAWGLQDALGQVAAFPAALLARDAFDGRQLGSLPLGERVQKRYGAPYATIHRADMHQLLETAVQTHASVQIHMGVQLQELREQANAVQAVSDGQTWQADAFVGADGLWGQARQSLLGDGGPRVSGHLAWRAMLDQSRLPPAARSQCVTVWMGPRMHAVQYPVRGGQWLNLVVITEGTPPEQPRGWDHQANTYELMARAGRVCAPLRELLEAASQASVNRYVWRLWPLCDRPPVPSAAHMARGRMALLGDAAHPMRPYLAQGAGMAVEDADMLGRCLQQADAATVPRQLQRYAQARWARCAKVQARSQRNGAIFHASGFMRAARNAAMHALGARIMDVPWLYSYQGDKACHAH